MHFDNPVSQKQLIVQQIKPKFGPRGYLAFWCIWGTFDKCSRLVSGYSVQFWYFWFSLNLLKAAGRIVKKRPKFGPWGYVVSVYLVLLIVKCSGLFWGHSLHFWFQQPCTSKTVGHRAKRMQVCVVRLLFSVFRVLLTFKCLKSSCAFFIFDSPVSL